MKDIFETDIQSENEVDDIFDEAVIDKNNWMMYGSTKPEKEGYKVTEVYEFSNNKLNKIEESKSLKEYVKLFSIRNKFKETKIKSENNSEYLEFNEIIMDKEEKDLLISKFSKIL